MCVGNREELHDYDSCIKGLDRPPGTALGAGMDTNREPEDQQREVAPVQALDGIVYEHVFRGLFVQWFRTQNPSNRCTEQY